MKALVARGKGFIGSHLVNYLRAKGHWVRSVDVKRNSYLRMEDEEGLKRTYHWIQKQVREKK